MPERQPMLTFWGIQKKVEPSRTFGRGVRIVWWKSTRQLLTFRKKVELSRTFEKDVRIIS